MFILPALIFLNCRAGARERTAGGQLARSAVLASAFSISDAAVAWLILCFGVVVLVAGTATAFLPVEAGSGSGF